MDLAQLRRDAGLAREQLLKIVQEDTPFSYRKFSALGGKGLTARLDNLVPDDYIVIVNNKNKEDYYRLPYKSFLNLLDIYQDELEDRRNRGSSKIAQIKKRAQGNRDKGKPDLFLQNDRLFSILDRTRDAVKLSQSKRQAETFTAEASKPVAPPPPPEPKKIEEGFSSINGTLYKQLDYDGISYLLDEDNYVYNDEYDRLGEYDGEDIEWENNKAYKTHKRKVQDSSIVYDKPRIKALEGEDYFFEGLDYKVNTEGEIFDRDGTIIAKIPNYPENKENPVFVNRDKHLDNYPIMAFPGGSKFLHSEPHPDWIKRRVAVREKMKRDEAARESERAERNRVIPPHPEDDDLTTMPVLFQGVEYRLLKPEKEGDKIKVMYGNEFIGYWDKGEEWNSTDGRADGFASGTILSEQKEVPDPKGIFGRSFRSDQLEEAVLSREEIRMFSLYDEDRGRDAQGIPLPRAQRVIWLSPKRPKWLFVDPVPEPESEEESEEELALENFTDDDDDDDDDEDDEDEIITLRYEGVFYAIEEDGNVVDDDFEDVGKWVNDDIKFTADGLTLHYNNPDYIKWSQGKSRKDRNRKERGIVKSNKIVWKSDKRPK